MKYIKEIKIIAVLILIAYLSGIGCPIKFLTGISCPGCGMTRACMSLLEFDFKGAFVSHPLVFLMPLLLILFVFQKRIPGKILNGLTIALIIIFMVTYLLRLAQASDIVYVDIKEGFVYKLISKLGKKI